MGELNVDGYRNLLVERLDGGVGLVRIHRPERRNALSQATMEELVAATTAFDADPATGCMVLTGDDRAFAAGADVAESAVLRAQDGSLEQGLAFERQSFYLLFGTEDQQEGVRAFLEKREPRWKGR